MPSIARWHTWSVVMVDYERGTRHCYDASVCEENEHTLGLCHSSEHLDDRLKRSHELVWEVLDLR